MQGSPLDPFPEGSAAALLLLREQTFPGGTAQHSPYDQNETIKNDSKKQTDCNILKKAKKEK